MKIQRIILDESEQDEITVGLVRLTKDLPDYMFFFQTNRINRFYFKRIHDLVIEGLYYTYYFPVFEGYCMENNIYYRFIANKASESTLKKQITELFVDEQNFKFLLNNYQEINYIVKSSDVSPDFSLILLPENLTHQIQSFHLDSDDELFQIIQYYE